MEQFANFTATTTLASAYTAGSGNIAITSAVGFPAVPTFSIMILDQTSHATKVLLRVTGISGTVYSVTAEGADVNAASGDIVHAVISVASLTQLRKDMSATGTCAALPTPAGRLNGDRYKCTDSPTEMVVSGGNWLTFMNGSLITPPIDSNFTWANQLSCTTTQRNDSVLFYNPGDSGSTVCARTKSQVGSTFTITMAFNMNGGWGSNIESGLFVSDGTKYTSFNLQNYNSYCFRQVQNFNSATSFNGNVLQILNPSWNNGLIWLKIVQDSTNQTFYSSIDGTTWTLFLQQVKTAWLTSTSYGYYTRNSSGYVSNTIIYSFTESTP